MDWYKCGQLAGSFVSGALTTVGLGAVSNVAGLANKGGKLIQLAGSAVVSAGASVPGTIAQNFVNNKINPDNKVDLIVDSFSNKIKKYYKWLCGNKDE